VVFNFIVKRLLSNFKSHHQEVMDDLVIQNWKYPGCGFLEHHQYEILLFCQEWIQLYNFFCSFNHIFVELGKVVVIGCCVRYENLLVVNELWSQRWNYS
jgi:hypothetical protein